MKKISKKMPSRIKIARICNWESPYEPGFRGGMGKNIQQSAEYLTKSGIETDIFTTKFKEDYPDIQEPPELPENVRQIRISVGKMQNKDDIRTLEHMSKFANKILEFIRKENKMPNLVHAHYWSSWPAARMLSYLGIPHILQLDQLHMAEKFYFKREGIPFDREWRLEGELDTIKSADNIVFVSDSQLNDFLKFYNGEDKEEIAKKIQVITNGTDVDFYTPLNKKEKIQLREKHGIKDELVLLYSGRLVRDKGIDKVITALPEVIKHNDKIRFFIVGKGKDEEYLASLVKQKGLEKYVGFRGYLLGEELLESYQLADFGCLLSTHETFGLSAIEAMACGLPVIGWKGSGGPEEIIDHYKNGFIVSSIPKLSEKIIRLVKNPKLRESLGKNGRVKCENKYNLEITSDKLHKLYLDLIEDGK